MCTFTAIVLVIGSESFFLFFCLFGFAFCFEINQNVNCSLILSITATKLVRREKAP